MVKANDKTAFNFKKFRVSNFSFNEAGPDHKGYDINFAPSGKYNEATGVFEVLLDFRATEADKEDEKIMNITSIAEFQMNPVCKFSDIPDHFFTNAIPIFFPYVRAFVSTLTLQANAKVIMLGLIKFTNVAEPLKQNTEIIK